MKNRGNSAETDRHPDGRFAPGCPGGPGRPAGWHPPTPEEIYAALETAMNVATQAAEIYRVTRWSEARRLAYAAQALVDRAFEKLEDEIG